jgi:hypothetical protein
MQSSSCTVIASHLAAQRTVTARAFDVVAVVLPNRGPTATL